MHRLLLTFLLLFPAILVSQQQPLTVLSAAGRKTLATTAVGDQEYVALDDLASMFQLTTREEPGGMIALGYHGKMLLLTAGQPLGSAGGRVFSLPAPVVRNNRRWLVPVDLIGRGLPLIYDQKLAVRRPSHLVIVGDLRVPRVQVRFDAIGANGGRLIVDATPKATSTISQDGDQLLVKFDADAIDFTAGGTALQGRLVDATTLAFTIGPKFGGFRAATQSSDTSIRQTIDLLPAAQTPAPEVTPAPASPLPDLTSLNSPSAGAVLRTIAIDPGHGGDDDGAHGVEGTKEKDVTLAVARKLKTALETKLGVRVLLTRDEDKAVAIDDRTAVANNGKADLFISLHANASWRPSLAGATVLTATFEHQAEQAARALPSELVPSVNGIPRDIEFIPWDSAQIPHLDQSAMLAHAIGDRLQGRVPLSTKSIDAATLRVLEPANMPAVLVEMGFLTNADQEKQLAGDGFQNTLVQALVDGVVQYRDAMGYTR